MRRATSTFSFTNEGDRRSLRGFRTDFSNYLASDTDFIKATDIMLGFRYGEMNDNDKECQCDLLTEDGCHEIDPTRLSYHERIRWHLKEFCYKTSSHGIPMLGQAPNILYRIVWIILLCCCALTFIYQAVAVVDKYYRMEKITDIQLKFDTAPFPAITLCNLNPYKDSLIRSEESISKILGAFKKAMTDAGTTSEEVNLEDVRLEHSRKKRAADGVLEPVYSVCTCEDSAECQVDTDEQKRKRAPDEEDEDLCICAFDRVTEDAWPCHRREKWQNTTCQYCDDSHNTCEHRAKKGQKKGRHECLCASNFRFCLKHLHSEIILNLWDILGMGSFIQASQDEVEALGFTNMTDEVAIVTKAKENIIFAMSALSEIQRRNMSQAKHNLIHKCSFNGKPCDIDADFQIISDPTFGNCFTFNHDRNIAKNSLRAGPMYGLRVMLFVNASDYLPTSEAVGVRLTIHDKDDFPFPDTFGYSAPTGYISSFGMRMTKMSRLPAPYGDCIPGNTEDSDYIYRGYKYSTEGCYRSCFQQLIIDRCGCGDPRFPSIGSAPHCEVFNKLHRECLEASTNELGDIHGSFKCRCQQPCNQTTYTISYSEAIWPSQSLNISLGTCEMEPEECNEQYQENAAMLEVFYEALNFEVLTESEAYGVVKMLADFGGQLGLWSGVSFMTCCEFICLGLELLYMVSLFSHSNNSIYVTDHYAPL